MKHKRHRHRLVCSMSSSFPTYCCCSHSCSVRGAVSPLKERATRYKSGTGWCVYVPRRKQEKKAAHNFRYNIFHRISNLCREKGLKNVTFDNITMFLFFFKYKEIKSKKKLSINTVNIIISLVMVQMKKTRAKTQ